MPLEIWLPSVATGQPAIQLNSSKAKLWKCVDVCRHRHPPLDRHRSIWQLAAATTPSKVIWAAILKQRKTNAGHWIMNESKFHRQPKTIGQKRNNWINELALMWKQYHPPSLRHQYRLYSFGRLNCVGMKIMRRSASYCSNWAFLSARPKPDCEIRDLSHVKRVSEMPRKASRDVNICQIHERERGAHIQI